jgi:hypothetical protein
MAKARPRALFVASPMRQKAGRGARRKGAREIQIQRRCSITAHFGDLDEISRKPM